MTKDLKNIYQDMTQNPKSANSGISAQIIFDILQAFKHNKATKLWPKFGAKI